MKKFIITEEEKKQIKSLYNINEQKWLANLLKTSADDLIRTFGDDVVKFENVLQKALSPQNKGITWVSVDGVTSLISATGKPRSMAEIEKAISYVTNGKLPAETVANSLPRKLADGTEFRSVFLDNFKKKAQTSINKNIPKLGSKGISFVQTFRDFNTWVEPLVTKGNMSGWKFHVFTNNFDDTALVYDKIFDVVKGYGAGLKLGGGEMFKRSIGTPGNIQYGKGVTIYIPSSVIKNNQQKQMLNDIQSAISDYQAVGNISGDKMITKNIGYRYELSVPSDPKIGVNIQDYRALYNPNTEGGVYNIRGNADIFQ